MKKNEKYTEEKFYTAIEFLENIVEYSILFAEEANENARSSSEFELMYSQLHECFWEIWDLANKLHEDFFMKERIKSLEKMLKEVETIKTLIRECGNRTGVDISQAFI